MNKEPRTNMKHIIGKTIQNTNEKKKKKLKQQIERTQANQLNGEMLFIECTLNKQIHKNYISCAIHW